MESETQVEENAYTPSKEALDLKNPSETIKVAEIIEGAIELLNPR